MTSRRWLAVAVCVVGAVACAPGAAGAAHRLATYRVAQRLVLDAGQTGTYTVACRDGGVATDGTWRIDSLDSSPQPDGQPYDLVNGVDVLEADSISAQAYRFALRNNAEGEARVLLAVACVARRLGDGRRVVLSARRATSAALQPGASNAPTATCRAGTVAIAPGFRFEGEAAAIARVVTHFPTRGLTGSQLGVVAMDPVIAVSSTRCLRLVTAGGGRRERLRVALRSARTAIGDGRLESYTVSCHAHEVAITGAFRLSDAWYLGQSQDGRERSFRVQSPATGAPGAARLGLLCLTDHAR